MLGLILAIIIAIVATNFFAHELENVSHVRANEDKDNPKRSLELGLSGRAVLAVIPVVLIIILSLLSKFEIATTIILLVLNVIIFLGYIWMKMQGFNIFWPCFFLIWANNIAGMIHSSASFSHPSVWMIIWSVLISILNISMIIIHLICKAKRPSVVLKWVVIIVAIVALFMMGYWLTNALIIPRLS
ncbi:MAG: hypothetical protein Q4E70_00030 [Candidatus Saccharibacteria bacterium]|nr:hypothetical protein [Candidatus Saccharibacteria bacterium]MDO4967148.1 hypothetical protein [Candidatus Saccharibacteria bacterium]